MPLITFLLGLALFGFLLWLIVTYIPVVGPFEHRPLCLAKVARLGRLDKARKDLHKVRLGDVEMAK